MKSKPMFVCSTRFAYLVWLWRAFPLPRPLHWARSAMQVTPSYHNDVSRPLRELAAADRAAASSRAEAAENPKIPNSHVDSPDPVVEKSSLLRFLGAQHSDADP